MSFWDRVFATALGTIYGLGVVAGVLMLVILIGQA